MMVPFIDTVELAVNPVPFSATVAAVLMGPAPGEMDVRVGGGGLVIDTDSAFDKAGVEVELLTVMVTKAIVVNKSAGTAAMMYSHP